MSKPVKAILFDFDDTLGDREVYAYKAYQEAVRLTGLDLDEFQQEVIVQTCMVRDQQGDIHKNIVAKQIEEEFSIQLAHPGYEDFNGWWKANLGKYAVLFPHVEEVLTTLKKRGYLLGVITNGPSHAQHLKLDVTGIKSYFDVVVVSGDTPYKKPEPEIFQFAAKQLNLECSECAFVGDMFSKDVLGAKEAGMDFVFMWPHGQRLITYPCKKIEKIEEILEIY